MSFLVWIILGLVAGYIANQIVYREGKGLWLSGVGITGINIYSLIVAVVGSVVVLWVYNAVNGRRAM